MRVGSHDDAHVRFLDEVTQEAAVRRRAAQQGLQDRASESATWIGTLRDLAERRTPVVVQLQGGRCHRGCLTAVSGDHVVLGGQPTVVIALHAIGLIRASRGARGTLPQGDRRAADERTLLETLVELLPLDPVVHLGTRGPAEPLRGTVVRVGEDLVSLRTEDGAAVVVPAAAVTDLAWGWR